MKNTKQFFAVFLSVMICVLVISAIAYATTTISTNIVTGGTIAVNGADSTQVELEVAGTASVSEELLASGSVQFGGGDSTATVSYSRLGAGTTGHSLADADDLLITGLLEVDDVAWLDNDLFVGISASISQELMASGSVQFGGAGTATASYSRFGAGTTGHSLADADDVLITGLLEVDATASFDALVSVSDDSGLQIGNGASLETGAASPSAACVTGSLFIDTTNGTISICDSNGDWSPVTVQ